MGHEGLLDQGAFSSFPIDDHINTVGLMNKSLPPGTVSRPWLRGILAAMVAVSNMHQGH